MSSTETIVTEEGGLMFRATIVWGHVEVQTRCRLIGNKLIGEGRSLHYGRDGELIRTTPWEPTGVTMEI